MMETIDVKCEPKFEEDIDVKCEPKFEEDIDYPLMKEDRVKVSIQTNSMRNLKCSF